MIYCVSVIVRNITSVYYDQCLEKAGCIVIPTSLLFIGADDSHDVKGYTAEQLS